MKRVIAILFVCAVMFACKKKADADATGTTVETETSVAADTISTSETESQMVYACPMHPEVTSTKKSTCPKCGMELTAEVSP